MRELALGIIVLSLAIFVGCANHEIVSDLNTSEVNVTKDFTFNKIIVKNANGTSTPANPDNTTDNDNSDVKAPGNKPKDDNSKEVFIPSIPSANQPQNVLVDLDYVFALVNGDVITSKDIQKDLINYIDYLKDIRKSMSSSPFDLQGLGSYQTMLKEAELNAIYRNFERKMLEILYEHKSDDLKMYLGSVPEDSIQSAIEDSKRQHGIFGDDEAANKKWQEILAANNLTYLEFREQIINQLNQQRTLWLISAHPDFRIDITLDVTPKELREEYLRMPVPDIKGVEFYRVEIPILKSNYDNILSKANEYRATIEEMLDKTKTSEINDRFEQITKTYYPFWEAKLEKLDQLNEEEPEIIFEINNASNMPKLCRTIELSDKVVIIFLVKKEQKGFAKFSSMLVQVELFRRLQNILWNEFRERFSKILINEATIIPGDLVNQK